MHLTADDCAIVESPDLSDPACSKHELRLIKMNGFPEVENDEATASVIEKVLQNGIVYHTIRHPLPKYVQRRPYPGSIGNAVIAGSSWCFALVNQCCTSFVGA